MTSSAADGQLQVATGQMLGSGFNKRWFYVTTDGRTWRPTYSGSEYKQAAQGKLMNFRAANAIFDDENRSDDNPDANTDQFIQWADDYAAHGVLGYTVSLQGGNPGYEGADASAFRSDGSLKQPWLDRASRLIEAANRNGQIVILTYFYQRQDERLANNDAVRAGVRNATDWLIANNHRNVIIEIANEYDSTLYQRSVIMNNSSSGGVAELIKIAQSRFAGKPFRLPVSVSTRLSDPSAFTGAIRDAADLVLIHGNLDKSGDDGANVANLVDDPRQPGPIVMNEDRQGGLTEATTSGLNAEKATATNVFNAGGSWGLMWQPHNQAYPFRWAIGSGTSVSGGDKANYFHAVLDHIGSLTMAKLHSTPEPPPSEEPTPSVPPTPSENPTPSEQPPPSENPTPSEQPTPGENPTPSEQPTPSGEPTVSVPPSTPELPLPPVQTFTVINADTDRPIAGLDPLMPNAVIDLSVVGSRNLTVRANVVPALVGSIQWDLDAKAAYRIENTSPYSLGGDKSADYAPAPLGVGQHKVVATSFTRDDAAGTKTGTSTLTFTVKE